MKNLTFDQFKTASGLSDQAIKKFRARDLLALAFGRREAWKGFTYFAIDAVAVRLADELASKFDRKYAAQLVRLHFDDIALAISHAETSTHDAFIHVVDFEPEKGGPRTHLMAGTWGNEHNVLVDASSWPEAKGYVPVSCVSVNVTRVIEGVRQNAKRAGFDLTEKFLPEPDDPLLAKILEPYREMRNQAISKVKEQKQREEMARRAGTLARAVAEAAA